VLNTTELNKVQWLYYFEPFILPKKIITIVVVRHMYLERPLDSHRMSLFYDRVWSRDE
jgi:hypothetical protein